MILNGYDTLVGSKFKITDRVESTIKTIATTNRLNSLGNGNSNVYSVTAENGESIPSFVFPITLKDYRNKTITVYDRRNYTNSKGNVVNEPELLMIETAAVLQQLSSEGNKDILLTAETYTVKAFARSLATLLSREGNLDYTKTMELEIIFGHYFNCLLTSPNDDYEFVSQNVLRRSMKYIPSTTASIISEVGYVNTLVDLVEVIKKSPRLPSFKNYTPMELVSAINKTWWVSSGFKMIIGAAAELPHLYTAICYVSAFNNIYRKTVIGKLVDIKENPSIGEFIKSINNTING